MNQTSSYRDRALLIPCQGERMLALLSEPAQAPAGKTGVLVIVGGPQYRAGSHRQFTLLGRALASEGVPTLRLDYRGMGDAEGDLRNFETVGEDVGAAIDAFVQAAGLESVLLWGLCDGASAALLYCEAQQDPRVRGLVLLNPWARSDNSLAKTQLKHYYWQRLSQPEFWKKLLGGGVGRKAMQDLLANARAALGHSKPGQVPAAPSTGQQTDSRPYLQRMAKAWREFGGAIQLIISGNDLTAKEFLDHAAADPHWRGLLSQGKVQRVDLAMADHTFSNRADSLAVQQHTLAFARQTHL
ncbi:exosortase A-associated hydrolase 1 [Paucibacter oligotrophus]|uniref:Exosortase A-associated hydrolase 1 n=1 Tax=Roseateles oligotrophus TaxID=1769250 RepID=A0A840LBX5_9BURK|nr:hydrolase 1, exosortase A system-associated [Roseateles oligotrophus]MBB4844152.1 exosortase A-associated hydrolase 1 [Roseateles oligotrophus]